MYFNFNYILANIMSFHLYWYTKISQLKNNYKLIYCIINVTFVHFICCGNYLIYMVSRRSLPKSMNGRTLKTNYSCKLNIIAYLFLKTSWASQHCFFIKDSNSVGNNGRSAFKMSLMFTNRRDANLKKKLCTYIN